MYSQWGHNLHPNHPQLNGIALEITSLGDALDHEEDQETGSGYVVCETQWESEVKRTKAGQRGAKYRSRALKTRLDLRPGKIFLRPGENKEWAEYFRGHVTQIPWTEARGSGESAWDWDGGGIGGLKQETGGLVYWKPRSKRDSRRKL